MDGNEGVWATGTGRAGTGQPVADPHPRLPLGWAEDLRRILESNPKPDDTTYAAWLTPTLRAHIKPLPPGTPLPPRRKLAERLKELKISPGAVGRAYERLAAEHLLASKGNKGTCVAKPGELADQAARPGAPQGAEITLPPDWVEELRRTLESNPKPDGTDYTSWLAPTLHTHIKDLHPGTPLPPRRKLAEHLKELKISPGAVGRAYARLGTAGQLTSESGDGTWVADPRALLSQDGAAEGLHGAAGGSGPVPGGSGTGWDARTGIPPAPSAPCDTPHAIPAPSRPPHPEVSPDWLESLRHALESNPKPDGTGYTAWLTPALHTRIKDLPPGTRLPSLRKLAEHLKGLRYGLGTVRRAYARLGTAGQLTSESGDGTWVADPGALLGQAAGSRNSQAAQAALPASWHPEGRDPGDAAEPGNAAEAEPSSRAGQLPQPSVRPQGPAHTADAAEGVHGATEGSEPAPGESGTGWDAWAGMGYMGYEAAPLTLDHPLSDAAERAELEEQQYWALLSAVDNQESG
jgi:DNA-binding transcriptional regulator YhcF (GntR family)